MIAIIFHVNFLLYNKTYKLFSIYNLWHDYIQLLAKNWLPDCFVSDSSRFVWVIISSNFLSMKNNRNILALYNRNYTIRKKSMNQYIFWTKNLFSADIINRYIFFTSDYSCHFWMSSILFFLVIFNIITYVTYIL